MSPVVGATKALAPHLKNGVIIIYESTVYPGVTEDICAPIIESLSGMKRGLGFKLGYSPERIVPGDKTHRLEIPTTYLLLPVPSGIFSNLRQVWLVDIVSALIPIILPIRYKHWVIIQK